MASLDKLAIRGIRSFDDKGVAVIEFFSPVTVIVGHNGSGKTTIIECLKYATTGDQPPNTRGGAFVHDPKMANEKEVKAQVKLRFTAANDTRMLVVRNLSVTMKKNGALTMKTLESILGLADRTGDKAGKRGIISTKCAEMDAEIPHLLGVSKAVLENVIFCHQEDSYWPLSEPAALKKKFDDIFEATKYTKALDSIKALRKDRVADLKAEKERLEALSREKQHADKLKGRVSESTSMIASKETEYNVLKTQYEQLVVANAKFYESATKFRETYMKLDNLNAKKMHYKEELDSARENLQEISGTNEELAERLSNFDEDVAKQKQKSRQEKLKLDDLQEELRVARQRHVELMNEQGRLESDEKAQEERIAEREASIRNISAKHQIKGFDHSPLSREQIQAFFDRLNDLRRKQNAEANRLQDESNTKVEEYNEKSGQLRTELEAYKQQKLGVRERVASHQSNITRAQDEVDRAQGLNSELHTLRADIEEKERRIETTKADLLAGKYEEKLSEKGAKARNLEAKREELNNELATLSRQSDARASLNLKRTDLKTKTGELKNLLEFNNPRFRKLVGLNAQPDSMERDLERIIGEKEREQTELERESNVANKNLQSTEANLSNLNSQLKVKQTEIKALDKKLKDGLSEGDATNVDEAVSDANKEVSTRNEELGKSAGMHELYTRLLQGGKAKKCCPLCTRSMNEQEIVVYDRTLKENIKKSSPEAVREIEGELRDWEVELRRLQDLAVISVSRDKVETSDIPQLERQISEQEGAISALTEKAEEALKKLDVVKKELKEMAVMRQPAANVIRTQKEIERLTAEIKNIESDLAVTGSTKSIEDVQVELDTVGQEIRSNDRERQNLQVEKDRLSSSLRTFENELHSMCIRESELKSELRDKEQLRTRIEEMKKDVATAAAQIKELDSKIAEAQIPIERLDHDYRTTERELRAKIAEAQKASQDLNMEADKLEDANKAIEKYVRERRGRKLKECNEEIEQQEADISELVTKVEKLREAIGEMEQAISESGVAMANLRENIRVRKLAKDIETTQTEIDSLDIEGAAKAKRLFEEKYQVDKQKETEMQSRYAHIGGEMSSLQQQLQQLQEDQKEFQDVNKKYRDQLIKVKMSDMANNDLEKYAKALDNAIMKYHSLKMAEVNDTMRHLWNKTYQGTDIDGIKISADNEGSTMKRSYNYRVVMTKDNVEMDMRGRCSAGQKMLASIIIRLALADSFGQNCGILALDEPTNALDTENIDALATSLVDIINERRSNSKFQLIIITHNENFLRKLGQKNVMDYYWRVTRDLKQKSIIERHRFDATRV